jgi:hypothetical protein
MGVWDRFDFFLSINAPIPFINATKLLVTGSIDRSNNILKPRDRAFKHLIDELALLDMPLQGRRFTRSNGREQQSFVRHDMFLISQAWNQAFPVCLQKAPPNKALIIVL